MAKLKFGAWIPTYAWSGKKTDPRNMQRIRESIVKCEKYGIDVWVIDHLLSAPGLYQLQPLLKLGDCLRRSANPGQCNTQVAVRLGQVGLESQRFLVLFDCLL